MAETTQYEIVPRAGGWVLSFRDATLVPLSSAESAKRVAFDLAQQSKPSVVTLYDEAGRVVETWKFD